MRTHNTPHIKFQQIPIIRRWVILWKSPARQCFPDSEVSELKKTNTICQWAVELLTVDDQSSRLGFQRKTFVPPISQSSPPLGDRLVVAVGLMGSEDPADAAF